MDSRNYILTLDAGTGSGRAAIFNAGGGIVSFAQREWEPRVRCDFPGSQVFDTRDAWDALRACIQQAMSEAGLDPRQISGVSATSMREGMVLYDKHLNEIWACSNVDARAGEEAAEMLRSGVADTIYAIGGDWLSIISPPRFRWIRRHEPEVLEKTAWMSMISDWILFKLSGKIVTDPTAGSSSGLFDLKSRAWSARAIELCDLPAGIYPAVCEPGSIIGEVTEQAAAATGLTEGTPVVAGGADTQMALLGVGSLAPNSWAMVAGTFWQTTVIWDRPLIDPERRLRTLCHASSGRWMTEGIGFLIGRQARWFRDGFCQEEVRRAREMDTDPYRLMEQLAETVPPGANGVVGIFSGVHHARSWKHAAPSFLNFDIYDPRRSGKAACIRALWESAVYAAYGNLMILQELTGTAPEELTFCGGSAKGFLWPQIVADVCGVPVRIPVVKEAASLGSAMCVGVATGRFSSLDDAVRKIVKTERVLQPDAGNHRTYLEAYSRWKAIYDEMLKIADQGLLTPMWRAPGT
jgi:autoinducer 2 (AI-2) kinase